MLLILLQINACEDLIRQFKKSTNDEIFNVKYNWNPDESGSYYISSIIGTYNGKNVI